MRWRLKSPASRWFAQPLFRCRSRETSKLRVTGLCEGDSPVTSLGWLYVFSSFPPPQQLLPLTSKPFELNLRYLAQRIYGPGEMYSMTFLWPWPKVMAVASISKNLLVCAIKWEPLDGSQQNMATLLPYFGKFSFKKSDVYFPGQTLFWPYLRNGWCHWCETKRKCIGWILGTICDLDLSPHSWLWPWMFQGEISK